MNNWISTNRKKPALTITSNYGASSVMVLAVDENNKMIVAEYFKGSDGEEWYDQNEKVIHSKITHWQQLPDLPPLNFEK